MRMEDYVAAVKIPFGGDIIETELDGSYEKIIEEALRQAKVYMKESRIKTYNWAPVIDTTEDRVLRVQRIFRGTTHDLSLAGANVNDPTGFDIWLGSALIGQGTLGSGIYAFAQQFDRLSQYQKMYNSLGSDIDYKFNYAEKKLFPISNRPPSAFTILYVLDYDNIEQVESPEWQNMIIRLAVALGKMTLGKIRGSWSQTSALYTTNAAEYVSEGNAEYQQVTEEMKSFGRHVIVKGN